MNLIIETDLGHDPDDFFTITWLLAAGIKIKAITITPGDPDQIAIAKFILTQIGLDIPVGASQLNKTALSSGSIHHELLKKYGYPLEAKADGFGHKIIENYVDPETQFLILGPLSNFGKFLSKTNWSGISTMQGGFVPFSLYRPSVILPKFEGKNYMPTFNLNGDREMASIFLNSNSKRKFVGKNVCHTIEFNGQKASEFKTPTSRAGELFLEGANLYFKKHGAKKFHDPLAAVCHLRPDIGTWINGKPRKEKDGWTTGEGDDLVLVDVNRQEFWKILQSWNN